MRISVPSVTEMTDDVKCAFLCWFFGGAYVLLLAYLMTAGNEYNGLFRLLAFIGFGYPLPVLAAIMIRFFSGRRLNFNDAFFGGIGLGCVFLDLLIGFVWDTPALLWHLFVAVLPLFGLLALWAPIAMAIAVVRDRAVRLRNFVSRPAR